MATLHCCQNTISISCLSWCQHMYYSILNRGEGLTFLNLPVRAVVFNSLTKYTGLTQARVKHVFLQLNPFCKTLVMRNATK